MRPSLRTPASASLRYPGRLWRGRQVLGQAIRQSKSPAPGVSGVVPFADALGGPVLGFRIATYSRCFKVLKMLKVLIYPNRVRELRP